MKYGVKSKTYSRYIQEFGSYGEARVFTLELGEVWNNATMQIYEIDGLQEDRLVEQFSPTKGVNYNKITYMKNKQIKLPTVDGFDPMAELDKLFEEAKRLKEKYSDKEGKHNIKTKTKNEIIKFMATIGWNDGTVEKALNAVITDQGILKKREGYKTFGEMVDVFWKINKQNRKMGFTSEYTVILPLRGTKPIYKKTLK